jgi:hypothetical protein
VCVYRQFNNEMPAERQLIMEERKRGKIARVEVEDADTEQKPTREELLDRLHSKTRRTPQPAQASSVKAAKSMAKEAAKSMAARYAAGTLTPQELQHMAAIEEGWTACGGDLKAFCAKTGISASMVPSIEEALAAAGAEGDVFAATDAVINKLTDNMF